jgi:Spy/CpxP family protein refolding chaperone
MDASHSGDADFSDFQGTAAIMKKTQIVIVLSLVAAAAASAQAPAAPAPGPHGAPAAKLLLSNTGELGLTDQQVVRLAAIARRSEARRAALRSSMDSVRGRFTQPGDSIARRQFAERMRTNTERARAQMLSDQRDAIAVLTPDQQARAWQMVSNRGGMRGSRDGMRDGRGRGMRGQPGMRRGMRGARGMDRGFRGREPGMRDRMDRRSPMRSRDRVPAPRPPEVR